MTRRVAVVTGANSGIGRATASALAKRGYRLVMVCRDKGRGEAARTDIGPDAELVLCDLSSLRDVRKAAAEIRDRHARIDVLINNAGAVFARHELSVDGWEMHFATNYLGPFALTRALLESLERSDDGRIVNVISAVYARSAIHFDDLNRSKGFRLVRAYAQSKLALVLFTHELARHASATLSAYCVDPGLVRTGIAAGTKAYQRFGWSLLSPFARPPEQAAETIVHVATDRSVLGMSGAHFKNLRHVDAAPVSRDLETASRLWKRTVEIVEGHP